MSEAPPESPLRLWIVTESGKLVDRCVDEALGARRSCVIGWSNDCAVTLRDDALARRHAALERRGDSVVLRDFGTTNGTTLNGWPVRKEAVVADGDRIELGRSILRIVDRARLAEAREDEARRNHVTGLLTPEEWERDLSTRSWTRGEIIFIRMPSLANIPPPSLRPEFFRRLAAAALRRSLGPEVLLGELPSGDGACVVGPVLERGSYREAFLKEFVPEALQHLNAAQRFELQMGSMSVAGGAPTAEAVRALFETGEPALDLRQLR